MGEMIVNGIKIAFWIGIAFVFMSAITTLLNLITSVVFANVIGEVLALVSMCLPFDAEIVFGGLQTSCAAILAFLVAKKIYEQTSRNNPLTS